MKRWLFFIYGAICHALFFGTFAYMAGFVGNFAVPKTIDSVTSGHAATALAIDAFLLALFAAQHSVMARPAFKRIWTRVVPEPIERSTYVLVSCLVIALMMWQWRSLDGVVWEVREPILRNIVWGLFVCGWLIVPAVSLMIDHFDLFGTRQVWIHLQGRDYQPLPFRVPLLYSRVRHPLYIGWTIAFWATPTMTLGHLLFAAVLTGYMALAALVEERDLIAHFGRQYEEYRRQVPMFVPRLSAATISAEAIPETQATAHHAQTAECHV